MTFGYAFAIFGLAGPHIINDICVLALSLTAAPVACAAVATLDFAREAIRVNAPIRKNAKLSPTCHLRLNSVKGGLVNDGRVGILGIKHWKLSVIELALVADVVLNVCFLEQRIAGVAFLPQDLSN